MKSPLKAKLAWKTTAPVSLLQVLPVLAVIFQTCLPDKLTHGSVLLFTVIPLMIELRLVMIVTDYLFKCTALQCSLCGPAA